MTSDAHERHDADLGRVILSWLQAGPKDGPPTLLLHGFASNAHVNWGATGWIDLLAKEGRCVIAPDHRGHGQSQKFYAAANYGPDIFAADAVALLDRLKIEKVDVIGYSMGARIAFWMAAKHVDRVDRVVFSGMGERMFGPRQNNEVIAEALEAEDDDEVTDPVALTFRRFAQRTGSDLEALAACIRPSRTRINESDSKHVVAPVLVAVGTEDEVAGDPDPLAEKLANATVYRAEGRDHMKAVGDAGIKRAVLDFLS